MEFLITGCWTVENEKDVATVDMPIDQHGEAQHSSKGHDQVAFAS